MIFLFISLPSDLAADRHRVLRGAGADGTRGPGVLPRLVTVRQVHRHGLQRRQNKVGIFYILKQGRILGSNRKMKYANLSHRLKKH